MVRMLNSGEIRPESVAVMRETKVAPEKVEMVKMEIEDHLEEEHGSFSKKIKLDVPTPLLYDAGASLLNQESLPHNLISEPSPLGLRLKKTPSLLDLIQMKLSQVHPAAACAIESGTFDDVKKELKSISAIDKMKASNFPASLLTIGNWEYVSRYEGDLVAKCYYAKHKIVWEVLDCGLKSKIEIQWSDIAAIKATLPENGPSTLDIVLLRQPLFFRETNPQPRKHTLWQATSDFTGGQASIHRRHCLQCPLGVLNRHFEKLIQCDLRLNSLSQEQEIILESPYFEPHSRLFNNPDDSKPHAFDRTKDDLSTRFSGFYGTRTSCNSKSTAASITRVAANAARETLSPISVMESLVNEENAMMETNELIDDNHMDTGLKSSMSIKNLTDHLEQCISEKVSSGNPADDFSQELLEEISQHLLSDNPVLSASDELLIMSKVNSFCSLLQKDDNGTKDDDENEPQLMMTPGTSF
ncbi:hypothetical protein IHE45_03G021600 [Dioscorea alata]|uniref:Uncharacterized protein n=1 Tax=Dioscorea alata TaxID=55571 RepID=A0ACB7WJE3_DIOAL|nr:hypothetical protein IHE45_03G021600 [Dioscorea alata]